LEGRKTIEFRHPGEPIAFMLAIGWEFGWENASHPWPQEKICHLTLAAIGAGNILAYDYPGRLTLTKTGAIEGRTLFFPSSQVIFTNRIASVALIAQEEDSVLINLPSPPYPLVLPLEINFVRQSPEESGFIVSRVVRKENQQVPVKGAEITLKENNQKTWTISDGFYCFDRVAVGRYTILCQAEGFAEAEGKCQVGFNQVEEVNFSLRSAVKMRGLDYKKRAGLKEKINLSVIVLDRNNLPCEGVKIAFRIQQAPPGAKINNQFPATIITTTQEGIATAVLLTGEREGRHIIAAVKKGLEGSPVIFEVFAQTKTQVEQTWPGNDEENVPVNTTIIVQFSQPMDLDSFKEAVSITEVNDPEKKNLFQKATYQTPQTPEKVVFQLSFPLSYLVPYKVLINAGVQSREGIKLRKNYSWQFKTETLVEKTFPQNQAKAVPVKSEIKISCREKIKLASLTNKIEVKEKGREENLFKEGELTDGGKTIRLRVKRGLYYHQEYQVSLLPGIETEREGCRLGEKITFSFQTESLTEEVKEPYVANYPNPVKGNETTFCFYLPSPSSISIGIYTLDYKFLAQLEGWCEGQYSEIVWDVSKVPPGIYLYVVEGISHQPGISFEKRGKVVVIK
jgi:hypothetical protein